MFLHLCVILFTGGKGVGFNMHHRSHDRGNCTRGVGLTSQGSAWRGICRPGGCLQTPCRCHAIVGWDTVNKWVVRILLESFQAQTNCRIVCSLSYQKHSDVIADVLRVWFSLCGTVNSYSVCPTKQDEKRCYMIKKVDLILGSWPNNKHAKL